jgi:heat shock protein 5
VQDAGAYARLDSLRIVDEPIAAAIAHGLHERDAEQRVLVYDLGGSAFRVSVMVINRGSPKVLATASDLHLGGADFDEQMMDHLVQVYRFQTGMDVTADLGALGKLKSEVERAKRELSTQQSALIEIGYNLSHTMTRTEFEELNMDLFLKTLATVEQVLAESGIKKEDVDEVGLLHDPGPQHISSRC